MTLRLEQIIEKLKQSARDSWSGPTGELRAVEIETFVRKMAAEYSAALNIAESDLLAAIEAKRTYTAINYYQAANFPSLDGVKILENLDEFKRLYPSGKYRCPACDGISSDPYACNSGVVRSEEGEPCNWKAYGLFGTLGKGLRITLRERFIDRPMIDEIFMPIEACATADADPVGA